MAAAAETCVGTIKALDTSVGWGSIECAQTQPLYGKDVLFQATDLNGRQVQGGEIVTFQVANVNGSPVAMNLQFLQPAAPGAPSLPPPAPPPAALPAPPPPTAVSGAPPSAPAPVPPSGPSIHDQQTALLAGRGGSYVGCVKSYNPLKGWGFIECPETGQVFGKDIFFLKSELGEYQAAKGDIVSFQVTQGKSGPMAQSVVFLNNSATSGPQGSGLYSGIIKSYNNEKGWGFIECDATRAIYGKDIFVLSSELKRIQVGPGQPLTFSVTAGKKGPIATDVQVIGAEGLPMAPPRVSSEQLCGCIKSWEEERGMGFITGDGIVARFGAEIPFFREALGGKHVREWDQVRFTFTTGDQGPVAIELDVLPSGSIATNGMPGQVYTGYVKSYGQDKGWGFVAADETTRIFGKDIFIHKREVPDGYAPEKGQTVCFAVQLNNTGRPEATQVSFPGAQPVSQPDYGRPPMGQLDYGQPDYGQPPPAGPDYSQDMSALAGLANASPAEVAAILGLAGLTGPAASPADSMPPSAAIGSSLSPMPPQADLSFLGLGTMPGAATGPGESPPAMLPPPPPPTQASAADSIAALAAAGAVGFSPAPTGGAVLRSAPY